MKKFEIGDWVVRKPGWRDSHPFWQLYRGTPMQVIHTLSNGDISFDGHPHIWMCEFFDPSEPPLPDKLEDWL